MPQQTLAYLFSTFFLRVNSVELGGHLFPANLGSEQQMWGFVLWGRDSFAHVPNLHILHYRCTPSLKAVTEITAYIIHVILGDIQECHSYLT